MKATIKNIPEAQRVEFMTYCSQSVTADRNKATAIHSALILLIDVFGIDALKGQKASANGDGISKDACKLVWQGRKAEGMVESEEACRTLVSRVWKYDVAPHVKETADSWEVDTEKLTDTNTALKEGRKGFSTGRYNDSVGSGSGGGGSATSKPQALITWYKGLKDDKKADFVASPEYATILSWK